MLGLMVRVEELGLLYKTDLIHAKGIDSPDVTDHINRVGIVIYKR